MTIEIVVNKAHTSASSCMLTRTWWEFIKDDAPLLHGIIHTPRLVVFDSGLAISEHGKTTGSIGLSGDCYSQDVACDRAALEAIGTTGGT